MKKLILLFILASFSHAHAQMSCMDLFNHSRPSNKQINDALYELKQLMSDQYSKDLSISTIARSESKKKLSDLLNYLSLSEVKERLKKTDITNASQRQNTIKRQLEESGNRVLEDILLQDYLDKFNYKDIHSVDIGGFPPLVRAAENNKEIAEILLKRGVDVNSKNQGDNTALIWASEHGGNKDVTELLIKYGADINAKNSDGRTALLVAADYGRVEILELLIKNGAVIDARKNNGETPLMVVARSGTKQVVEILIQHGANVNNKCNENSTALMKASSFGQKDIVELLLSKGADINARNKNGDTALKLAIIMNKKDVADVLRAAGGIE